MECLQYLARQRIAFRGNNDIDSNFAQLILLRSKEHPWIRERITSGVDGTKKYTHNEYQGELLNIMASQVLRKKLYDINNSKMFAVTSTLTFLINSNFHFAYDEWMRLSIRVKVSMRYQTFEVIPLFQL